MCDHPKWTLVIATLLLPGTLPALAADLTASAALQEAITSGKIYKIDRPERRCPSVIQLARNDKWDTSKKKEGDLPFRLKGYELQDGRIAWKDFTHENDSFNFRPSVKEGKSESLERNCEIILGIACRFGSQKTEKESVLFEGSAKILSFAMIAFPNVALKFDTHGNKLNYTFKASGIDDVVCDYSPAPELTAKVRAFNDEEECRRSGSPEKCRQEQAQGAGKVSDKDRKHLPDTLTELPASTGQSRAGQAR